MSSDDTGHAIRLDRQLDAILNGDDAPHGQGDPETTALLHHLMSAASRPQVDASFVERLRETLLGRTAAEPSVPILVGPAQSSANGVGARHAVPLRY